MDLFLEAGAVGSLKHLRHELVRYLARHATPDSDIGGAELVVDEVVANAIRHTEGPVWVTLDWLTESPRLTVRDLGPGFSLSDVAPMGDPLRESGRGLFLVSHLAPQLDVAQRKAGGAAVTVTLPVSRPRAQSMQPAAAGAGLPAPAEARDDGTFDRESFLRALVVQLAHQVERDQGPEAAESSIAGVGLAVGGRMEEEYRRAESIVGQMTPQQMGDLYVRLKHAIDGDFYLIEADEEKIVLGNRRCPFGDVVQRAPALCRMTSSVFGGIAARNRGSAGVLLEERIAVGDPGCRVVVWLKDPPADAARFAHRYDAQ